MARRDLTTGSIPQHFRALALPTAVGMVLTTLYKGVEVYYAGMLGTEAQAGLAISFIVFFILFIAIGVGLSSAMGALVGHALGQRSGQEGLIAAQGITFGLGASVFAMAIGWLAAPWLIALVSEPGAYRDAANQYLRVLMFGAPAFVLAYAANGILTAQGDTKSMQYANMAAFFANLVLNPLFIFGLGPIKGIGFDGIALSTVVSQAGVMAYVLWRALRSEAMAGPRRFAPKALQEELDHEAGHHHDHHGKTGGHGLSGNLAHHRRLGREAAWACHCLRAQGAPQHVGHHPGL